MQKTIRQHEPQTVGEFVVCLWCGRAEANFSGTHCIARQVEVSITIRPLTAPACEDADAIHVRLIELQRERDAAMGESHGG